MNTLLPGAHCSFYTVQTPIDIKGTGRHTRFMMNSKLLIALLVAVAVAGCIHDTDDTGELPNGEDVVDNVDCQNDIDAAQQASAEADACTAEFAEMQCPHDDTITYGATDGCEISALEARDWERVTADEDETVTDETDDETDNGTDEADEDTDETVDDESDDELEPVHVDVGDNHFTPDSISAAPGQEIVFENVGNNAHTVTIDGTDYDETLSSGETVTVTIDEEGTYSLTCSFHAGQDGTITIEA